VLDAATGCDLWRDEERGAVDTAQMILSGHLARRTTPAVVAELRRARQG